MTPAKKKHVRRVVGVASIGGGGLSLAGLVWAIKMMWPVLTAVATTVPQVNENTARLVIAEREIIECKTDLKVFQARNDEQHKALMDKAKDTHEDVRAILEKL
ncbi:hypothetical protein N9937_01595 [bacterium]|nr:hypothetical protein [bacterium]